MQRFVSTGLTPPSVDFIFHPSTFDCYGHVGHYYVKTDTIHVCRLDKSAMLHELAHAWLHENLAAATITAFIRSRNLTSWNAQDGSWKVRGTEHAAEIIAWALLDRNRLVRWVDEDRVESYRLLTIPNSSPAELADGFELLTGKEPSERLLDNPSREASLSDDDPEAHRGPQHGDSQLEASDRELPPQSDD